jgi:hypothetical protein
MHSIPIQKTITTKEAQLMLNVTPSAISWMARRGKIIRISNGVYDRASVLAYAGVRRDYNNIIHKGILNAIIRHFQQEGEFLSFRDLQKKLLHSSASTSSVSTLRFYLDRMEKAKLVDRSSNGHIYPFGFRDKIKKLAQEEYPDVISKA